MKWFNLKGLETTHNLKEIWYFQGLKDFITVHVLLWQLFKKKKNMVFLQRADGNP